MVPRTAQRMRIVPQTIQREQMGPKMLQREQKVPKAAQREQMVPQKTQRIQIVMQHWGNRYISRPRDGSTDNTVGPMTLQTRQRGQMVTTYILLENRYSVIGTAEDVRRVYTFHRQQKGDKMCHPTTSWTDMFTNTVPQLWLSSLIQYYTLSSLFPAVIHAVETIEYILNSWAFSYLNFNSLDLILYFQSMA